MGLQLPGELADLLNEPVTSPPSGSPNAPYPIPASGRGRRGPARVLSADLHDRYGFLLTVSSGRHGYYDAADDGSRWEWEPDAYVNVGFQMGEDHVDKGLPNMLTVVDRALSSGSEDAALVLNGDLLLLTRFGGTLRKHNRSAWWDHYGFVYGIMPG